MVELAYGTPPGPVNRYHRYTVTYAEHVDAENRYYNEVTSFLFALFPDQLVRVTDLRRRLYLRHGIYSFDSA